MTFEDVKNKNSVYEQLPFLTAFYECNATNVFLLNFINCFLGTLRFILSNLQQYYMKSTTLNYFFYFACIDEYFFNTIFHDLTVHTSSFYSMYQLIDHILYFINASVDFEKATWDRIYTFCSALLNFMLLLF